MDTLLSIVLITCNRKDEIIKAIESCRTHTERAFEVVVIDNNSTDGTETAVRSYCVEKNLSLQYHYLDQNTGVSFARNIGYREANGDILFFIDDDAVVISEGNSLDLVADYMRTNKEVMACVGTSIDYRYGGKMSFVRCKSDMAKNYYQVRSYVGFNHFIKKGFTDRDYIYPDNLFYGSEELYVGLSVLKYGGKIVNINEHVVQHNPSVNTRIDRTLGLMNGYINTYIIKRYFLRGIFKLASTIMFNLRIIRFSKLKPSIIKEIRKLSLERYDSVYENQMTFQQIWNAIRKFGYRAIL